MTCRWHAKDCESIAQLLQKARAFLYLNGHNLCIRIPTVYDCTSDISNTLQQHSQFIHGIAFKVATTQPAGVC